MVRVGQRSVRRIGASHSRERGVHEAGLPFKGVVFLCGLVQEAHEELGHWGLHAVAFGEIYNAKLPLS